MSKPVLITVSVLMVLLVGLVKRDGTPIHVDDTVRVLGMEVRVTVKLEVNPPPAWEGRQPGLVCVAAAPVEGGGP